VSRPPVSKDVEIDNVVIAGDALHRVRAYGPALRAFLNAACLGSPAALVRLGYMVEHGQGTPSNRETARNLYRMAADQGDPAGEYLLGRSYVDHGTGNIRSLGMEYLRRSAANDYPPALYALGTIYAAGETAGQSHMLAKAYIERAAGQGHLYARMATAKLKLTGRFGIKARATGIVEFVSVMIDAAGIALHGGLTDPLVLK